MKIEFKPIHMYLLHRSDDLDHGGGRPVIYLQFFKYESLVWMGITTYFYNKGLSKVATKDLVGKWRDNYSQKIIKLNRYEQEQLVSKFSQLTLVNPYLEINILRAKIIKFEKELFNLKTKYQKVITERQKLVSTCSNLEHKLKEKETKNNGQQFNP